jgi:hypothetical protein
MKATLLIVAALVVAGIIALLPFGKSAAANAPTDDDVIEQLRLAGSNLSKPHPIDFYIYVPSKEAAERVSGVLSNQGFRVKVQYSAIDSNWLALASKSVVPTSAALAKLRQDLTALATHEHGQYDGWEAAVVKEKQPN